MVQISHQLPVHVINFFHHKISLGFVFFISVPWRDLNPYIPPKSPKSVKLVLIKLCNTWATNPLDLMIVDMLFECSLI